MSNNVILRLKSVLFNLKYQEMCDYLPTMYILHNKYPFMIILVRKMRLYALTNQKKKIRMQLYPTWKYPISLQLILNIGVPLLLV